MDLNFLDKMDFSALRADWFRHELIFKRPSGTSRGVLKSKNSYIIRIFKGESLLSCSEVSLISGLSLDEEALIPGILDQFCEAIDSWKVFLDGRLESFPAVEFGIESLMMSLKYQVHHYFENEFLTQKEIPINGLIWMGDPLFMKDQLDQKLAEGFKCVKLKIGAIDFSKEIGLLKYLRENFDSKQLEIRVDANGAFGVEKALDRLKALSEFDLHSIEQPIKQGQWSEMADLCSRTPLPIALDEELIGVASSKKRELLETIKPQYIILKPSLLGGFRRTQEWVDIADEMLIPWWVTSALESNVGLNAVAQYTSFLNATMYQGLGTGALYENNFESPLVVRDACLRYDNTKEWGNIG